MGPAPYKMESMQQQVSVKLSIEQDLASMLHLNTTVLSAKHFIGPGTDFNQTVIEIEKAADPTGNNVPLLFEVALMPSNAVEGEETFLLLLNVTGGEATVGAPACSTVQIGRTLPSTVDCKTRTRHFMAWLSKFPPPPPVM